MPAAHVDKVRRQYNRWVATESIEDYALRYSPASFRKWSPTTIGSTLIGTNSALSYEAIGALLLLDFGFSNAIWALVFSGIIIFLAGLPICHYSARHNIDMDLLTRAAGFGYVGSTFTSLIYASFTFIFLAVETAIMAQAIKLYFGMPLWLGYIVCTVVVIPVVYYGVTAINRFHQWTQPLWLVLLAVPFYYVLTREPAALAAMTHFVGEVSKSDGFDPYHFGIAAGISFALIAQIGEQVDYLRFMPERTHSNRFGWWANMLAGGPGWIVIAFVKQLGGMLLAAVAVLGGIAVVDAKEPIQIFNTAFRYAIDNPDTALMIGAVFVCVSELKVNVTNAYAGSLAWSNFFSRVTHSHPGRVVWLVFNSAIALMLMELDLFEAMNSVLGLYSNVAVAWICAVVADLAINKPLGLSPPLIEFKRAHLYNFNPVGVGSTIIASLVSTIAFTGVLGDYAQAYSWLIAAVLAFLLAPAFAYLTQGRYYIARRSEFTATPEAHVTCGICDNSYSQADSAHCPHHGVTICSLCCTLDPHCHDRCKPQVRSSLDHYREWVHAACRRIVPDIAQRTSLRIANFNLLWGGMLALIGATLWIALPSGMKALSPDLLAQFDGYAGRAFFGLAVLASFATWWIILVDESRNLAVEELRSAKEHAEAATEELALATQRTRKLLDSANDAVITIDADSVVIDWNPAAERIFGWSREEAMGHPMHHMIVPEEFRAAHEAGLARFLKTGQGNLVNQRIEIYALTRDGSRIEVELSIWPVKVGDTYTFSSFVHDITRRKQAEAELAQARDVALEATRIKSDFLANMSHEIRTPMNAIIGMSHLALKTDLDTRQRDYVGKVHTAATALLRIINDILDFSKVEAGKLELENAPFALDEVFESVRTVVGGRAEEKGLEFVIHAAPDVPARLTGDPLRLGQVMINLANNAVKFTERGRVDIAATICDLDRERVVLRISVCDTGIGMTAAQRDKLFQPFSQADGSTTRKYGGTGLGLTISKRIVEAMGGEISVESVPDVGSIFSFTAAFALGPDSTEPETEVGPLEVRHSVQGMRILLVEDNEINRQIAAELLREAGADVAMATNGQEALDALMAAAAPHFDVVLMDLQMPVMDGYEATRRLRADSRFVALPIIAMTAHAMAEERQRCLDIGMNDHVGKPFVPATFLQTVARWRKGDVQPRADGVAPRPAATPPTGTQVFPVIAGLDTAAGLSRVNDNHTLYLDLLRSFSRRQADIGRDLRAAHAAGDHGQLKALAHMIKGVAGNLGADALCESAAALEHAIDAGAPLPLPFDTLLQHFDALAAALVQALPEAPSESPPDVPGTVAADAWPILQRLVNLLREQDGEAVDLLETLAGSLRSLMSEAQFSTLRDAVSTYDYARALAHLSPILEGAPHDR
jgi:PAS domain S-box-containing protein